MSCSITKALVKTDIILDYLPISPVSNLVDLFQKCVVLPFLDKDTIQHNRYFTHLEDKSFIRCILLVALPVIGNIAIAIYDAVTAEKDPYEGVENVVHMDSYPWGDDAEPDPLPEGWEKHIVEDKPLKYFAGEDINDIQEIPVGTVYYTSTGTLVRLRLE